MPTYASLPGFRDFYPEDMLLRTRISANGLTGYLRTWANDLNQFGRFAAVLR